MATLVERVTDLLGEKLNISKDAPEALSNPVESQRPDIEYHPDEAKWKARTARRLAENPDLPKESLPEGFPKKLDSPLVWEGKDWKDPSQWEYDLSEEQLKEIDDAVRHFKSLNKPFGYINPSTFPLPKLGPVLRDLSRELHHGRGFFVLRTIPVDSYSREDNVILYAGVSSYVGALRGTQDTDNGVVAHIKDLSVTQPAKTLGLPAFTTDKQVFHTDAGDIIALYVTETAIEGGLSRISSSWKVYNELVETRPDLIKTLSEPWAWDGFGKPNQPAYSLRPLLFYEDNKIVIQYARRLFTGFNSLPRTAGIPNITEAQAEALDTIHFIAQKYNLALSFQKGDIQYINNLSIFHGRDGYVDDPARPRHLIRLWLRDEENAWKIPPALDETWKKLYYSSTPDSQRFPLDVENRNS